MTVDTAPTASGHVTNKAYVDNAVAAAGAANSGVSMLTAEAASTYTHANAVKYCRDLSAAPQYLYEGGSDSAVYTDWRLPTVEEGALFEAITADSSSIWTATVRDAFTSYWIRLRLSDGSWTYDHSPSTDYVRCVR